jgi:hypothetical protein
MDQRKSLVQREMVTFFFGNRVHHVESRAFPISGHLDIPTHDRDETPKLRRSADDISYVTTLSSLLRPFLASSETIYLCLFFLYSLSPPPSPLPPFPFHPLV